MTKERLEELSRTLKMTTDGCLPDVIIHDKEIVRNKLLADKDLLELLDTPGVSSENPEALLNNSIFSHLKYIPDTQSTVKNFILFDVDIKEPVFKNEDIAPKYLTIVAITHEDNVNTSYGIDRQDLMAFIIKDIFSDSNCLGLVLNTVYDVGGYSQNGYLFRTLKFEAKSPHVSNFGGGLKF